jgi:hypothetical protein
MSDRVFYCPECRQQYPDSRLPPRGQLFDCPHCHLLFIPADKDFAGGVGLREYESKWADEGIGKPPKSPFSEWTRRRLRRITIFDLIVVWLTGVAMLAIAWIIFVIAHGTRERQQLSPPIARSTDPPPPVADAPVITGVPNSPKAAPAESTARWDENTLLGDWESAEQPLEGVAAGDVFAIAFGLRGALTIQSRSVLEVETITGQWRYSGSTLMLKLGEVGRVREVAVSIDVIDASTIRLTTLGRAAAEFKRKKN